MAWIESHQELARHPKTKRLARALSLSLPAAVGHLHFLWWWAMDYAQNGDLSKYTNDDIAEAAGWEGEPRLFIDELIASGFVDDNAGSRSIHDWFDYAGRVIDKREQNRERMRRARANSASASKKHKQDTKSNSSRTCDERATHVHDLCAATVPNPTVPDPTVPDRTGRDVDARAREDTAAELITDCKQPEPAEHLRDATKMTGDEGAPPLPVDANKTAWGEACKHYEDTFGELPPAMALTELEEFVQELEPGAIMHAMDVAKAEGVRKWSYIRAILTRYRREGLRTLAAVQAAEAERARQIDEKRRKGELTHGQRASPGGERDTGDDTDPGEWKGYELDGILRLS